MENILNKFEIVDAQEFDNYRKTYNITDDIIYSIINYEHHYLNYNYIWDFLLKYKYNDIENLFIKHLYVEDNNGYYDIYLNLYIETVNHHSKDIHNSIADNNIISFIYYFKKNNFDNILCYCHLEQEDLTISQLCCLYNRVNFLDLFNKVVFTEKDMSLGSKYGSLESVKYIYEKGCPVNIICMNNATRGGHINIIKYFHENGCIWDETTCESAVLGNNLDILIYLRENGCPWDGYVYCMASRYNYLDIIKYALSNDCPFIEDACHIAKEYGNISSLLYMSDNIKEFKYGDYVCNECECYLKCLQYEYIKGTKFTIDNYIHATTNGYTQCVKWLYELGYPIDTDHVQNYASKYGKIDILKYLVEKGFNITQDSYNNAVENNRTECVEYLNSIGNYNIDETPLE